MSPPEVNWFISQAKEYSKSIWCEEPHQMSGICGGIKSTRGRTDPMGTVYFYDDFPRSSHSIATFSLLSHVLRKNKTIVDRGITVVFWIVKVHTSYYHWIPLDHRSPYFHLIWNLDHLGTTWGSSNSFGSSKTIFPFPNTLGWYEIARK